MNKQLIVFSPGTVAGGSITAVIGYLRVDGLLSKDRSLR
jgi:hypothetical protein